MKQTESYSPENKSVSYKKHTQQSEHQFEQSKPKNICMSVFRGTYQCQPIKYKHTRRHKKKEVMPYHYQAKHSPCHQRNQSSLQNIACGYSPQRITALL